MANSKAAFFESYRTILSVEVIGVMGLATLIAASTGPFGTFSAMGFGARLGYWGLVSGMSVFLGYTGFAGARALGCRVNSARYNAVGALTTSVFITAGVWSLNWFGYRDSLGAPPVFLLFFNVLLIAVTVALVRRMIVTRAADVAQERSQDPAPEASPTPESQAAAQARPRLARRLPEGMEGAILHLSVSDHHVDIHTENGVVSVRMRLADAIEAMDGVPGMRVHRSHWVARAAIDGVVRDNGRIFLSLSTGARVPVSRGAKPQLAEMGLLSSARHVD